MLSRFPFVLTIGIIELFASSIGAGSTSAAASDLQVAQYCSGRTVTMRLSWQGTDAAALQQWLDLSTLDNGFAPGTFVSAGPLSGDANSYQWSGITHATRHFLRINQLKADGRWDASPTWSINTVECAQPAYGPAVPEIAGLWLGYDGVGTTPIKFDASGAITQYSDTPILSGQGTITSDYLRFEISRIPSPAGTYNVKFGGSRLTDQQIATLRLPTSLNAKAGSVAYMGMLTRSDLEGMEIPVVLVKQ